MAKLDAYQRQFFCNGLQRFADPHFDDMRIKSCRRRRRRSKGPGYNGHTMPVWVEPDRPMQPPKYVPLKKYLRPLVGHNHMS
eukprot:5836418-Pyramimonas_sp.AAC.1